MTISRKKIHLGSYTPPEYENENFSETLGVQLLDVLVDEDGDKDRLVIIGKIDRGKINVFQVDVDNVKELERLGPGIVTGAKDYDPSRDASCVQRKSDETVLLVATLDTKKKRGRLCQISLE